MSQHRKGALRSATAGIEHARGVANLILRDFSSLQVRRRGAGGGAAGCGRLVDDAGRLPAGPAARLGAAGYAAVRRVLPCGIAEHATSWVPWKCCKFQVRWTGIILITPRGGMCVAGAKGLLPEPLPFGSLTPQSSLLLAAPPLPACRDILHAPGLPSWPGPRLWGLDSSRDAAAQDGQTAAGAGGGLLGPTPPVGKAAPLSSLSAR